MTSGPENRAGHRNADQDEANREAVKGHILQFRCRASHYGRRDSPGRKDVPHELSTAKLHSIFKEQNDDQVSFPSTTQCFVGTSTWDSAALQQMWVQLAPYTAAEL
ncbi:hypothetical protein RRG08_016532 [Elysia crispata]|uniref:Uncharacterized protein n=1 Tax=Elysia crispata TaxID=231223 RepID=A0AAE0YTE3_9GAST|nr:hypothetical protein RRG08_016532 [Elysia crispata]